MNIEKFKQMLKEKKLTTYKLSKMSGVSQSTINNWLRGERKANESLTKVLYSISNDDKELKKNIEEIIEED